MTGGSPPFVEASRLRADTFVRTIELHDELPSTNDRALERLGEYRDLPALIVANRQTAGRGRGVNRWWGADGALTFSLILDPEAVPLPRARWPELSMTAGASVCEVVAAHLPGRDVRIKWPNDVYVDDRKICGILVEAPPTAAARIIVGIGINVNNTLTDAPDDVRRRATSLIDCRGTPHDRTDLLAAVLVRLATDLSRLAAGDPALPAVWRRRCLLTGRIVTLRDGARSTTGLCQGIDDDGALRLFTEAGPQRFVGGVVEAF